jgi:hypothetical protein
MPLSATNVLRIHPSRASAESIRSSARSIIVATGGSARVSTPATMPSGRPGPARCDRASPSGVAPTEFDRQSQRPRLVRIDLGLYVRGRPYLSCADRSTNRMISPPEFQFEPNWLTCVTCIVGLVIIRARTLGANITCTSPHGRSCARKRMSWTFTARRSGRGITSSHWWTSQRS